MWRRTLVLPLVALAGGGMAAQLAFGGATDRTSALRLPALHRCVQHGVVRVTFAPGDGVALTSLSVRVGADEVLQLADLGGPGSVRVTLPAGRSRVRASATTSDGDFVQAGHTYRRCGGGTPTPAAPKPKPKPKPKPNPTPYANGGGTD